MKTRHLAIMLALGFSSGLALAQRATHPGATPATPAATSHNEAASTSPPAEHKPAKPSHSAAAAARFQKVTSALQLSTHQQKSIGNLIKDTREQLADIRADKSLTPQQQQQAVQKADLTLAQKFVGLLTPQQKKDLEALLVKQQQKKGSNANASANSAAAGSGSASAPDIPSVDMPSGSDSEDSGSSSSSSSTSAASISNSGTSTSGADSTSGNGTATASGNSAATPAAAGSGSIIAVGPVAPVAGKTSPSSPAATALKPGRLTDAQLAVILNSFVQDESEDAGAKPSAHSGSGSGS